MKLIYSLLLTVLFSVSFSLCAYAQPDYLKKAESFIAAGDYVNAERQLIARRAYLDSKKVDKNSNEYIDVEKKLAKVTKYKSLLVKTTGILSDITSDSINERFELAEDTLVVAGITEDYMKKLKSARSNLREVTSTFPSDRSSKAKLVEVEELISLVKDYSENFGETIDWRYAKTQNSKSVYEAFLRKYPGGKWGTQAKEALSCLEEEEAWNQCSNDNNSTAYGDYLAKFPKGSHKEKADSLHKVRLDEETWAAVNTKDELIAYMKNFPSGLYAGEASAKLADMIESEVWSDALSANTVQSLNGYILKYPDGKYVEDAKRGLMRLEEKDAWTEALNADTIEAYQEYLNTTKNGSYEADARNAIERLKKRLEKEQAVESDNASWNLIKSSTNPNDFKKYLSTSSYRDPIHERDASFMYNTLMASDCYSKKSYSESIKYYEKANSIKPLSKDDAELLLRSREELLYSQYVLSPSVKKGQEYISAFPDGRYSKEISQRICRNMADAMSYSTTYGDYQNILLYAKTDEDRRYVDSRYRKIQDEVKKTNRRMNRKSEIFHLLLGVEGFYLFDIVEVPYEESVVEETYWALSSTKTYGVAPVISLGGRSNRFNLEAGYDFINNQAIARPRVNLLKKRYSGSKLGHRRGSNYSLFAMYVAPEAFIDVKDIDNTRYGVRCGLSLHWFDLFGGYKFDDNRVYFGLGLYFGNK